MKVGQKARNNFYSQSQRTFRRAHREGTSRVRQGSAEEADRYICSQLGVVPVPSAGPWSTRSCLSLSREEWFMSNQNSFSSIWFWFLGDIEFYSIELLYKKLNELKVYYIWTYRSCSLASVACKMTCASTWKVLSRGKIKDGEFQYNPIPPPDHMESLLDLRLLLTLALHSSGERGPC